MTYSRLILILLSLASDLYTHSNKLPQLSEKCTLRPVSKRPESVLGLCHPSSASHRRPSGSTPTINRNSTTMLCLYCHGQDKASRAFCLDTRHLQQPELGFYGKQLSQRLLFQVGKDPNVFAGTPKILYIVFCLVLISLFPSLAY